MQGCGRSHYSRHLLSRLAGRTQVPALTWSCPIQEVVPVAPLRCGRIRCSKTITGVRGIGRRTDSHAQHEKGSDKRDRSDQSWNLPRHDPLPPLPTRQNVSAKFDRNASQLWACGGSKHTRAKFRAVRGHHYAWSTRRPFCRASFL
jgi:hypothetical protein